MGSLSILSSHSGPSIKFQARLRGIPFLLFYFCSFAHFFTPLLLLLLFFTFLCFFYIAKRRRAAATRRQATASESGQSPPPQHKHTPSNGHLGHRKRRRSATPSNGPQCAPARDATPAAHHTLNMPPLSPQIEDDRTTAHSTGHHTLNKPTASHHDSCRNC